MKKKVLTSPATRSPKVFMPSGSGTTRRNAVQVFQFSQQGLIDPIISNLSDEEISQEPHAYDFKAEDQRPFRHGQALQRRIVSRASVARRKSTSRSKLHSMKS